MGNACLLHILRERAHLKRLEAHRAALLAAGGATSSHNSTAEGMCREEEEGAEQRQRRRWLPNVVASTLAAAEYLREHW